MSSELRTTSETRKSPKGILKNAAEPPRVAPAAVSIVSGSSSPTTDGRPPLETSLSEREITQMNTEMNAGGSQRRNSSNARSSISRRQSGAGETHTASPRLKWDEANLYLNEGQMGGKMKIDEPKTPFAPGYDPSREDDDDDNDEAADASALNVNDIVVDELDKVNAGGAAGTPRKHHVKGDDIPGLDLGEPELAAPETGDGGEKRVIMNPEDLDLDGGRHGEDDAHMTVTEREKHHRFEQMRKKHYEMRNVKDLLAHPSDDVDDEE